MLQTSLPYIALRAILEGYQTSYISIYPFDSKDLTNPYIACVFYRTSTEQNKQLHIVSSSFIIGRDLTIEEADALAFARGQFLDYPIRDVLTSPTLDFGLFACTRSKTDFQHKTKAMFNSYDMLAYQQEKVQAHRKELERALLNPPPRYLRGMEIYKTSSV